MTTTTTISTTLTIGRVLTPEAPVNGERVNVEVELEGERLSFTGSTARQGGQMQDAILAWAEDGEIDYAPGWNLERVRILVGVWRRWHLNDMRAGCVHQRAAGWDERPIDPAKPTSTYGRHFEGQRHPTWNMLTWVTPKEYERGLLAVPCPECGYRYGTAWQTEPLPDEVMRYVRHLAGEEVYGDGGA